MRRFTAFLLSALLTLSLAACSAPEANGPASTPGSNGPAEGKTAEELLKQKQDAWKEMTPAEHVALYEEKGIARKEAMRLAARDRGVSKREIYQALLEEE